MNRVYLSGVVFSEPKETSADGQVSHVEFELCVTHETRQHVIKNEFYHISAWNRCAQENRAHIVKGARLALEGYLVQRLISIGIGLVRQTEITMMELLELKKPDADTELEARAG